MVKLVVRGLMTRKLRTVLTSFSILLGVAMISGTFVLTDQINNAFSDIFKAANKGTDAVVSKQVAFGSQAQAGPLPESIVTRIRSVPGVAEVAGSVQASGSLVVGGKIKAPIGGAPSLVFSTVPGRFNPLGVAEGRHPSAPGEVAILTKYAKDAKVHVGQHVGLTTRHGVVPVTIVGTLTFAGVSSVGGATVVETTLPDAQRWYDREGQVSTISVAADRGVTPPELVSRLKAALPPSVLVETGEQNAAQGTKDTAGALNSFLGPALLAFGGVAVLVGAFIIFNTFSITVGQRIREFGMLRTIGASRRQVLSSVVGEALLVGLLASLIGIAAGFGVATGINALFDAIGVGIPHAGTPIAARTIIVGLLVGVLVTLAAAVLPAVRATQVPPIAVLREGATLPPGRFARYKPIVEALLAALGIGLLALGVFGSGGTSQRLLTMAIGAVLIFVAVGMLAKHVVRPMAEVIGWPLARLGIAGRLARENAMRNPARTAVTAAALMIGIGLVTFVTVFAQGLRVSFDRALDRSITSDLIVQPTSVAGGALPPATAGAIARAPGVAAVSPLGFDELKINRGGTDTANGVDPRTLNQVYRFDWKKGSDAVVSRLGLGGTLVERQFADSHDLHVGSTFHVTSREGKGTTLRVLGIYKDPQLMTGFIVSNAVLDRLSTDAENSLVLVRKDPGTSVAQVEASVKQALQRFPEAKVQSNAEYKDSVRSSINGILNLLYGLLAVSVIISLFGIVNTLVLTIYERTREIGMLRAIGTSRRQLRRMVRYESVITSTIGGVLGIVVGLFFGWVVTKGLESQGIQFAVPGTQLVVFLVVAAIAGVLAAVFPARRAARLNVLEALHYE